MMPAIKGIIEDFSKQVHTRLDDTKFTDDCAGVISHYILDEHNEPEDLSRWGLIVVLEE